MSAGAARPDLGPARPTTTTLSFQTLHENVLRRFDYLASRDKFTWPMQQNNYPAGSHRPSLSYRTAGWFIPLITDHRVDQRDLFSAGWRPRASIAARLFQFHVRSDDPSI